MCAKLNSSLIVHRLVADLQLRPSATPVQTVLGYCHDRVNEILADYGTCSSIAQLLDLLANKLETRIIEISNDRELNALQREYVKRGEHIFATLADEFADPQTYGITIKLQNRAMWEQPYVSIIDCRNRKHQRKYHTKWHELGHLLILTDQTRLAFRRSHDPVHPKSAEESLVDAIAGEFSFYPPLVTPHLKGQISFAKIEMIRSNLCPEASIYSAILNISKLWPTPCIWLEAQLASKKGQERTLQQQFGFQKTPQRTLRAIHTSANEPAREYGIGIIRNFRVPKKSVISRIFEEELPHGEACEDLADWESSIGTRLQSCNVRVEAKWIGGSVHALIVPIKNRIGPIVISAE